MASVFTINLIEILKRVGVTFWIYMQHVNRASFGCGTLNLLTIHLFTGHWSHTCTALLFQHPAPWYQSKGDPLQWRSNGRDGVSIHQPHDSLLQRLFRRRSRKTSKLRLNDLCAGNSPVTGEFPVRMASNTENVFIWWHHRAHIMIKNLNIPFPWST